MFFNFDFFIKDFQLTWMLKFSTVYNIICLFFEIQRILKNATSDNDIGGKKNCI
jgi:hypothetical protein